LGLLRNHGNLAGPGGSKSVSHSVVIRSKYDTIIAFKRKLEFVVGVVEQLVVAPWQLNFPPLRLRAMVLQDWVIAYHRSLSEIHGQGTWIKKCHPFETNRIIDTLGQVDPKFDTTVG